MALHEEIENDSQIHNPRKFFGADDNTVLSKDQNGQVNWIGRVILPAALDLISSILPPTTEVLGDIYLIGSESGTLDVDTIVFQSGNTIRYTFNGSPDLTPFSALDFTIITGSTNASNDGTFIITTVNDGSDFIEVTNDNRSDGSDDEATDSPSTVTITHADFQGAPQNSWVTFDDTNWTFIDPLEGMLCYLLDDDALNDFNGTTWAAIAGGGADGNGIFDAANDGGTVPSAFNFALTDTLAITGSTINGFSVNGTTFSVDMNSGRVGIGNIAPTTIFEVDRGVSGQGFRITEGVGVGGGTIGMGIEFKRADDTYQGKIFAQDIGGQRSLSYEARHGHIWYVNGTKVFETTTVSGDGIFLVNEPTSTSAQFSVEKKVGGSGSASILGVNNANGTGGATYFGIRGISSGTAGTNTRNVGGFFEATGGTTDNHALTTGSGNVGFGTNAPDASALLDMVSTTQGLAPPSMTGAQVEAISSPKASLIAYASSAGSGDVTTAGWWGWNGSNWIQLG